MNTRRAHSSGTVWYRTVTNYTMNSLYNHGVKQTQLLTRDLALFEKNFSTLPMSLQGSISTTLTAFKKTIKEYTDLVRQSNLAEEKHLVRLQKFQADLAQFTAKFDSLRHQRELHLQAELHQELMGRRPTGSDNPYEQPSPQEQFQQQQQQNLSYLEGLHKEKQSLGRGNQQLEMILEMGQSAFEDLVEQNETLRKLGNTFEQSLMTLGVSQSTIRRVERRAKQDKWIFWGMVVVFFVICYYLLKWFH